MGAVDCRCHSAHYRLMEKLVESTPLERARIFAADAAHCIRGRRTCFQACAARTGCGHSGGLLYEKTNDVFYVKKLNLCRVQLFLLSACLPAVAPHHILIADKAANAKAH